LNFEPTDKNLENLIRTIIEKILEELKSDPKKETVLILGKRNDTFNEKVVSLIKSKAFILFMDDDFKGRTIDRYVLPELTLNQMGDLVRGMARGKIAGEVLAAILRGKTVEVVEYGYSHYSKTAPEPLLKLYESQKQTLKSFGIKEFKDADSEIERMRKKLITQIDIQKAKENGKSILQVPKESLITALAAEYARDNSIEILKK